MATTREDGEANFHMVGSADGKRWLARVQLNGEIHHEVQRWIMAEVAEAVQRVLDKAPPPHPGPAVSFDPYAEKSGIIQGAGVQPDPVAAQMVSEAAELLEKYGDHKLGDL